LFDSNLLEFAVGDSVGFSAHPKRRGRKATVQAAFLDFSEKTVHTLKYDQVDSLQVNVPTDRWYEMGSRNIDSLLEDELTSAGPKLMQHAFLFASGSTISITFAKVSWKTKKLK
jgi:hypothetical protein